MNKKILRDQIVILKDQTDQKYLRIQNHNHQNPKAERK